VGGHDEQGPHPSSGCPSSVASLAATDIHGPEGGESRGVVDMIAIRKDHGRPYPGTKRGDSFQIVLIQIKGGQAAKPTDDDLKRLRKVARRHNACGILLSKWRKGKSAQSFSLRPKAGNAKEDWAEIDDLAEFFK
jgi:hypothetical protein